MHTLDPQYTDSLIAARRLVTASNSPGFDPLLADLEAQMRHYFFAIGIALPVADIRINLEGVHIGFYLWSWNNTLDFDTFLPHASTASEREISLRHTIKMTFMDVPFTCTGVVEITTPPDYINTLRLTGRLRFTAPQPPYETLFCGAD
jgi:hypothetical protein